MVTRPARLRANHAKGTKGVILSNPCHCFYSVKHTCIQELVNVSLVHAEHCSSTRDWTANVLKEVSIF